MSRVQQELLSGAGLRVLPLYVRGVQALHAARHVPPVGPQSHRRHAAVLVTGGPGPAALQRAALRSPDRGTAADQSCPGSGHAGRRAGDD